MAAGARHSEPEEGLGEDIDHVVDAVGFVLSEVHRAVRAVAEVIERRPERRLVEIAVRVAARILQQVTGDLLFHQWVVRHIRVERPAEIVARVPRIGDSVVPLMPLRRIGMSVLLASDFSRLMLKNSQSSRPEYINWDVEGEVYYG